MRSLKLIIIFALIVVISSCKSTFYITNTNTQNIDNSGILYALPKTKLNINIEVTETHKQKGPFSDYTYLYFNTKNAITENDVEYRISDISVQNVPVIDSTNIYCINPSKSNSTSLVNLTPEGFIAGINLNDYRAEKIQIEQKDISELSQKNKILDYADYSLKSIQETAYDTIYKEVIRDSVLVRIPIIKKKKVFKSTKKQAKEIADILFLLRDDRNALLIGENDGNNFPDGKAIKIMLEELNKLENQYMSLFTGREIKVKKNYEFNIVPKKILADSLMYIFSFSEKSGVSYINASSGKEIYLKFNGNNELKLTDNFTKINLETNEDDKKGFEGLIYRIPANIITEIIYDNTVIFKKAVKISQFGTLNIIPADIVNDNISIEFYPRYGSLKRISKIKAE